jgi:5-methylcytosine-specific restriction endonuclease McrA
MLVSPGPRCPACQRVWTRLYDRTRPAHHALYATAAWKRLSAEVRASANRCHWCLKPTRRLVADHVIPLDQRPDLALERSNLVAACVPCNTRRGRNAKLPDLAAFPEPATARPDRAGASFPGSDRPGVAGLSIHPNRTEGDLNV